ncbi:class I SAM-dependent methyltransferase [Psychroserpens sp. SPM9]|uniref:class I SAM-dependent methyltransferase n=1 Tax=Psychroserpens sp. SPM9 TaxID=2975598 RepID=UPI0021A31EAF|nr:class I SAM-dependent methyltransferase [Psychroserpens sp. SPM9]MDG5492246.1 methyltransferase domain-containing protein [Psychroserpens sp. SPM9]
MNLKHKLKSILGKAPNEKIDVGKSNERDRKVWLKETLKNLPNGSKILDAGAGQQQYKAYCTHLEYVSQDFGGYEANNGKPGLQKKDWDYGELDIISDIASIPREDASFDAIMCIEVLEHVVNPKEAIAEFTRLLKPGGTLIITAPFCSLTHFAPYHFYSGFNSFFYETELEKNGFEIVNITANGNYFEYLAQEVNRLPSMSQRYSNVTLDAPSKKLLFNMKKLLKTLSDKDANSSELLCYGYHVLAKKK